ncbi:MAG TPA: CorA family divalent cation transporter, partial [Candidatus Saccharimonadales bacterium]
MVKYFYKSLRSQSMQQLSEYKRGVWVYAEAPSADEIQALTDAFDLELGIALDALDENEMPRLEKGGEQNYIFVRYARKDGEGGLETMPLLFVFAAGAVITISPTKLPCIDKFLKGKIDFATTQRTKLILQILNEIVEGFDGLITQKSKQIKAIRARLRGQEITDQD